MRRCSSAPSRASRSSTRSRTSIGSTRRSSRGSSCAAKSGLDLLGVVRTADHRHRSTPAASGRCSISPARRDRIHGARRAAVRHRRARRARDGDPDRRGRQPGAGHGAQRQPDGRGPAPALWPGEDQRWCSTRTDRRAEIGHEDVERTVGIDRRGTRSRATTAWRSRRMNKGRPWCSTPTASWRRPSAPSPATWRACAEAEGGERKARPAACSAASRPSAPEPGGEPGHSISGREPMSLVPTTAFSGAGIDARSPHYQELKSRIHQELLNRLEPRSAARACAGRRRAGDPQPDRRHARARERDACRSACSSARR